MKPRQIIKVSSQLSVSYRRAGEIEAKTLVFLHAFPLSSAMWQAQIDEFAPDFEVFAPDFRGIGKTSPFTDKPSLQVLAGDLALWLEELGLYGPITLVGLSMGGYVALEFARQFPQFLGKLVLCDTRADADSPETRKARTELIEFAKNSAGRAIATKLLPKLLGETTFRDSPRIAQSVKAIASTNSGKNLAELVLAMRERRDSTDFLPEIAVPTLVLGGNEDAISNPEIMAQVAAKIPGAKHVVIEGAGHLSNLEKPAEFNAALREFLTS